MEASNKNNMGYKIYSGFATPSYQSLRFTELYRKYYLKRQRIKINNSDVNCNREPTSMDTVQKDNPSCNEDGRISEISTGGGKLQETADISHKMTDEDLQQKEILPLRKISFKISPRPSAKLLKKLLPPPAFTSAAEISETRASRWRPTLWNTSLSTASYSPSFIKPKNDASEAASSETRISETIPWDPGTCSGDTTTSSSNLDNRGTAPVIETCNGNNDIVDCGVKESAVDNSNLKSHESEEDYPPLANEDSDIKNHVGFESFSDTDKEEEEERYGLAVTLKQEVRGRGGEQLPAPLPQRLLHRGLHRARPRQHRDLYQEQHLNIHQQYGKQYGCAAP